MSTMSTPFPRMRRRRFGYDPEEVDRFIAEARAAFNDRRGGVLTSADIRRAAFGMQRGGYATAAVDAALERLEDAFAARERERVIKKSGEKTWYGQTRGLAKEIIGRLERPDRRRFTRVGALRVGYSTRDVDVFAERAKTYFEEGAPIAVDAVRTAAFRPKRNGYSEAQVDLLIDGLVEVMLAVK